MALPDRKTAVITGASGQDGYYLTKRLLELDYNVIGVVRHNSQSLGNASEFGNRIKIAHGDITDLGSVLEIVLEYRPQEIYNLAAQSHVHRSFDIPIMCIRIYYN